MPVHVPTECLNSEMLSIRGDSASTATAKQTARKARKSGFIRRNLSAPFCIPTDIGAAVASRLMEVPEYPGNKPDKTSAPTAE